MFQYVVSVESLSLLHYRLNALSVVYFIFLTFICCPFMDEIEDRHAVPP